MSEITDDTPVTMGMLEMWGASLIGIIKKEFSTIIKAEKDSILNQVSENTSRQIDDINARIGTILSAIEKAQPQEQTQVQAQRSKINLGELGSQIREIVAAAKEANLIQGDQPSELDRWGAAFAEIAKREALSAMKLNVRRGLKKRIVDANTIENIVGEKVGIGGANHEPVL